MEFKKLGRFLQKERRAQRISLRDIAAETRINIKYLKAIEEGRVEELPQDPYLTIFLRSYCNQIGLDFQEVKKMLPQEVAPPVVEQPSPSHRWLWVWLFILPILGLAIILYPRNPEKARTPPPTKGAVSSAVSGSEGLTVIGPDTFPQMPHLRPDTLKLELVGIESTWVFIEGDSGLLWQGILNPGQRRTFYSGEGFLATVGNAGGIVLFLNGKRLPKLGPSRKVVHNLRIDRETVGKLLLQ